MMTTSALEQIKNVVVNRHSHARDLKERTGKRVLGYLCTYVPEELLYAAGVVPIRVLGGHKPTPDADQHIATTWCPFCRDCLQQGLEGKYDYLDGLINAYTCWHIDQTFDSWQLHLRKEGDFFKFLFFPGSVGSAYARETLVADYRELRQGLERWVGHEISDAAIEEAIELYDRNRRLMKQIWEMRKNDPPPLTGAEALQIAVAGQLMDKKEHNALLEQLLEEIPQREQTIEPKIRLMIVGSEFDDVAFLEMVESWGCNVVIEELCTTTRGFWQQTPPGATPLDRIASRLLERLPCPQKDVEVRVRPNLISGLAREYNVKGLLLVLKKFCDPHQWEVPPITKAMEEVGIPTLVLETDVINPAGQFRTRIEAFLEMLEMSELAV